MKHESANPFVPGKGKLRNKCLEMLKNFVNKSTMYLGVL